MKTLTTSFILGLLVSTVVQAQAPGYLKLVQEFETKKQKSESQNLRYSSGKGLCSWLTPEGEVGFYTVQLVPVTVGKGESRRIGYNFLLGSKKVSSQKLTLAPQENGVLVSEGLRGKMEFVVQIPVYENVNNSTLIGKFTPNTAAKNLGIASEYMLKCTVW